MAGTLVAGKVTRSTLGSAVVVGVVVVCACVAVVAGVLTGVLGAREGVVGRLPVSLGGVPSFSEVVLPCVQGWPQGTASCEPAASAAQWPGGERLPVTRSGDLTVDTPDVGTGASLLSTSGGWSALVAAGLVALVLVPVLRTTSSGRPFARGNARRLAAAAGVVASAWALTTVGPYLAAGAVIRNLEQTPRTSVSDVPYDLPAGWLVPQLQITWWPALLIALLACLAVAIGQGTRMAADVEGLV